MLFGPRWIEKVYWIFWSNIALLIGSSLWLASPIWCWLNDEPAECGYLAFVASCFLFVNATFSMMDCRVSRLSGEPIIYAGGVQGSRLLRVSQSQVGTHSLLSPDQERQIKSLPRFFCCCSNFYFVWLIDFLERRDWYFYTNLTFLLGAFGDIITNTLDSWIYVNNDIVPGYSDIVATHLWALSGLCGLVNWYFHQRARNFHNAPYQFTMLPWRTTVSLPPPPPSNFLLLPTSAPSTTSHRSYDSLSSCTSLPLYSAPSTGSQRQQSVTVNVFFNWFGWGDWFFIPGGFCYAAGAYVCLFTDLSDLCWGLKTAAAGFYLIDSMFYWPDVFRKKRSPHYYSTSPEHKFSPPLTFF